MNDEPSPLSTLLVVGLFVVAATVLPPVIEELFYIERTRPKSLRRARWDTSGADLDETDRWLDDLEKHRKRKRLRQF